MNLTFSVCDIGNRYIRIQDITQQDDEYVPEDLQSNDYSIKRYFNYKYSETCTINILYYNSTINPGISNIVYTTHESYLDEAEIYINKDGHYTVHHMVLPTIEWLNSVLADPEFDLSIYEYIYVTDGQKAYKYQNGELQQIEELELIEINTYHTTLSRCEKQFFHIYDLYKCFIQLSNAIFNTKFIKCPEKSVDTYYRDFVWSAINVMKLYIEKGQYESAQLLLEKLDSCNGICKTKINNETTSSCGCS